VIWLALDTATQRASVAVGPPGAIGPDLPVATESLIGARRHAALLWSLIDRCLERAACTTADLAGVVVADGPGSFTGLRVGAAAAKALVQVRGIPLASATSLLSMAAAAGEDGALTLALSDALRDEVFVGGWRVWPDRIETAIAPTVCARENLSSLAAGAARIVGPAAPLLGFPATAPEASVLLRLVGRPGGGAALPVSDPAAWEPDYGRPAEAQARWERAHGRRLPHTSRHDG
jgi:tRNA threonylcarbamoyladenosine biosynthesis protein TsaB